MGSPSDPRSLAVARERLGEGFPARAHGRDRRLRVPGDHDDLALADSRPWSAAARSKTAL